MSCPNRNLLSTVVFEHESLRLEELRGEFARRVVEPMLREFLGAAGVPQSVIDGAAVGYNYAAAVTDQNQFEGKRP